MSQHFAIRAQKYMIYRNFVVGAERMNLFFIMIR